MRGRGSNGGLSGSTSGANGTSTADSAVPSVAEQSNTGAASSNSAEERPFYLSSDSDFEVVKPMFEILWSHQHSTPPHGQPHQHTTDSVSSHLLSTLLAVLRCGCWALWCPCTVPCVLLL